MGNNLKAVDTNSKYLQHYGVLGMHWGIRRYQNKDGSLTDLGQYLHDVRGGSIIRNASVEEDFSKDKTVQRMFGDCYEVNDGGRASFQYSNNRTMNCSYCSTAYCLRRQGYDVQAKSKVKSDPYAEDYSREWDPLHPIRSVENRTSGKGNIDSYPNATRQVEIGYNGGPSLSSSQCDKVTNTLAKQGEGAYGIILVSWKDGVSGHAFNYEVHNGKVYYIDCQVGDISNDLYFGWGHNATYLATYRIDDQKVDKKKADQYVESANNNSNEMNKWWEEQEAESINRLANNINRSNQHLRERNARDAEQKAERERREKITQAVTAPARFISNLFSSAASGTSRALNSAGKTINNGIKAIEKLFK